MSLQDWANSRPKGVSFEQFHADGVPYRSERHFALDDFAPPDHVPGSLIRWDRRSEAVYEPEDGPSQASWRASDLCVAVILVVFMGLWAAGVLG